MSRTIDRLAELRLQIVEKELESLIASSGLEGSSMDLFREESLASNRTGIQAIVMFLAEKFD